VEFKAGDAFQLTPEKTGEVDWLFSDVICYPEKLLEFVQLWIASGKAGRMLCTIKMQGGPDPAVIARFQELGRVMHLHHNKHELTWFYSR
jgi:23S rRNA (cytidine2498-2'-O)-methyltransferase